MSRKIRITGTITRYCEKCNKLRSCMSFSIVGKEEEKDKTWCSDCISQLYKINGRKKW